MMRFKQLSLALISIGLSLGISAAPVLVKQEQKVEEYRLENGLKILLAPNDKESKVYVNTVYFTGALDDPKGKGGLAHLLEHLAFKGTKNVQGEEFQRRLDQYTLMTNATTDYHSTRYIHVLRPDAHALKEILYLEAERMDKLVLQEKFVPAEIEIVKREREVRLDQPFSVLMDQVWKSAYGNQYLGRLPIGDIEELKSINLKELEQFYQRYYAPNNAAIVIAGKFDKAEVLNTIDQHFTPLKPKTLPARVEVPKFDISKMQQRVFSAQKGSDYAKFNLYMHEENDQIKPILALSPLLFTLQPSGHLYQNAVETGLSTAVQSSTWLDQNFNLVYTGAIYAPNHDAKKLDITLNDTVEGKKAFSNVEIQRVKNLVKNAQAQLWTSSPAVGQLLADYLVSANGDWTAYFKHQDALQNAKVEDVNQVLSAFLTAENRIRGEIQPTPESQKTAQTQKEAPKKTLDQQTETVEPLKDISTYQNEVSQYVKSSAERLKAEEAKIQRGALKNGLKYAFYPVQTRDNRTYASIDLNFGTAESLKHKAEIVDITAYLLLRGSKAYNLQAIADRSIELDASAQVRNNMNGMTIQISATSDHFNEYFNFIIELLKSPTFEQSQFDLIQSQTLASLNRPYTEPSVVSQMTLAKLLERYTPGDLRYHFEPELAKKSFTQMTRAQVQKLYQDFLAANHAHVAVTGPIDQKQMLKNLERAFAKWNSKKPYAPVFAEYQAYTAQKHHVLAEQREFGSYQSVLTFPVGAYHQDAAALAVIAHILGDSQLSSRLGIALREKNALVYGFGSQVDLSPRIDSGALSISANYTAGRAAQVSEVVQQVLQKLLKEGVTEQELAAAKADILKKRVNALEDERNIHRMLVSQLELGRNLLDREQRDQEYASLTKAQVDAVIAKYIKLDQLVEVMADQYAKASPDQP